MAILIHLYIIAGYFYAIVPGLSSVAKTMWPSKTKVFTEKILPTPNLN